ncbi:AAA family ATPase [Actinosynnema sp. NPDC020468]|uniref:AAA family ATPase n=1 Tax=Actinosynnema sp. NPDC020468 TaxID=3154488 RepID=UPI003402FBF3
MLIVLNGPPGVGKSTLARRYAADHPPALNLDVDRVRDLISGDLVTAGVLARDIAVAAARVHLAAGHDVVVPQYLGRPEFAERLESLARELGVRYAEVVLHTDREDARRRYRARGGEATDAELAVLHDRLERIVTTRRPSVVRSAAGEEDRAYRDLLAALAQH